jgi:hypothetical protein
MYIWNGKTVISVITPSLIGQVIGWVIANIMLLKQLIYWPVLFPKGINEEDQIRNKKEEEKLRGYAIYTNKNQK